MIGACSLTISCGGLDDLDLTAGKAEKANLVSPETRLVISLSTAVLADRDVRTGECFDSAGLKIFCSADPFLELLEDSVQELESDYENKTIRTSEVEDLLKEDDGLYSWHNEPVAAITAEQLSRGFSFTVNNDNPIRNQELALCHALVNMEEIKYLPMGLTVTDCTTLADQDDGPQIVYTGEDSNVKKVTLSLSAFHWCEQEDNQEFTSRRLPWDGVLTTDTMERKYDSGAILRYQATMGSDGDIDSDSVQGTLRWTVFPEECPRR